MPLDELEMMANPPGTDRPARVMHAPADHPTDEQTANQADIDKAAGGETMPAPKEKCDDCPDTPAGRMARRGQDPPAHTDCE